MPDEFFDRAFEVPTSAKKIMAHTDNLRNAISWRFTNTCTRLCSSALYIHTFLGAFNVHPWYFRFLPRQCCMLAA